MKFKTSRIRISFQQVIRSSKILHTGEHSTSQSLRIMVPITIKTKETQENLWSKKKIYRRSILEKT